MIQVSRLFSGGYYFRSDVSTLQLDKKLLDTLTFTVELEKKIQSHRLVFKNDEVELAIYLEI